MNEAHWLPKSPQIFWKVYSAAINYKFEFLPMLLRISQIDVKANPYHRSPYILSFAVTASWDYLLGRECAWCDFFSIFFSYSCCRAGADLRPSWCHLPRRRRGLRGVRRFLVVSTYPLPRPHTHDFHPTATNFPRSTETHRNRFSR